MQIDTKYIAIVVIVILLILWYTKTAYSDVDRYKKIIDTYIGTNIEDKPKPVLKKVSILEPSK